MRCILHLNVTALEPHHDFWSRTLGGDLCDAHTIDLPGAQIRLTVNPPSGGTKGTPLNHVAFAVPNVKDAVALLVAGGYPIVTRAELPALFNVADGVAFIPSLTTSVAFTMGPDEVKVEAYEVRSAQAPFAFHHAHFFSPEPEKMKQWYAALFGVTPADRGHFHALDIPNGFNLTFSASDAVVPTRGRAIDRLGFEVDDASSFKERLLVDPWGTALEISAS
jgi:catechol 2,3-dioxygenase-like lactoylglutathione lyase family enzyme